MGVDFIFAIWHAAFHMSAQSRDCSARQLQAGHLDG